MAGDATGDLFVGGVGQGAAGIAADHVMHAADLFEIRLDTPETASCHGQHLGSGSIGAVGLGAEAHNDQHRQQDRFEI